MKFRQKLLLPLILVFLFAATVSQAQLWSGLIDPSRAIDWTNAGIPGGIPSSGWTQCVTNACATLSRGTVTESSINAAMASALVNSYVLVPAGTFTIAMSNGFLIPDQVELRGSGADKTIFVPVTTGSIPGCNGLRTIVGMCGPNSYPNGGEQNSASWTAGFSQGTTSITLSNSLNINPGKTILNLDEQDEGADTGNIWNCLGTPCGGFSGGFARTDNTCSAGVSPFTGVCSQEQQVLVTACSPSCNNSGPTVLTISPGLYMTNWRSSQNPGAWWPNTMAYRRGVANMSIDLSSFGYGGTSIVTMSNCTQCWVRGLRSIAGDRNHIYVWASPHAIVRDNYLFAASSHGSGSYGIELAQGSSDDLIENNICDQLTAACVSNSGGGAGSVGAFNFAIDNTYAAPGWFQAGDYDHGSGFDFWLREGNIDLSLNADNVHGTHHFTTAFRNYYSGWQAICGGAPCNAQTIPIHLYAASRYFNLIGNVLGQPGYHTNYNCLASGGWCGQASVSIFVLGFTGNNGGVTAATTGFCSTSGCTSHGSYDPLTATSLLRWGNYDVVNNSVQFNSSEVPSSFADTTGSPSIYANHLPSSHSIPASLHYTAKPGWWPAAVPWPPIGPDVTGGNVSAGSGPSASLGGHVFMNPAMNCFINVMGGRADGTGSLLSFNADSCYGSSTANLPSSPTGLAAVVQ